MFELATEQNLRTGAVMGAEKTAFAWVKGPHLLNATRYFSKHHGDFLNISGGENAAQSTLSDPNLFSSLDNHQQISSSATTTTTSSLSYHPVAFNSSPDTNTTATTMVPNHLTSNIGVPEKKIQVNPDQNKQIEKKRHKGGTLLISDAVLHAHVLSKKHSNKPIKKRKQFPFPSVQKASVKKGRNNVRAMGLEQKNMKSNRVVKGNTDRQSVSVHAVGASGCCRVRLHPSFMATLVLLLRNGDLKRLLSPPKEKVPLLNTLRLPLPCPVFGSGTTKFGSASDNFQDLLANGVTSDHMVYWAALVRSQSSKEPTHMCQDSDSVSMEQRAGPLVQGLGEEVVRDKDKDEDELIEDIDDGTSSVATGEILQTCKDDLPSMKERHVKMSRSASKLAHGFLKNFAPRHRSLVANMFHIEARRHITPLSPLLDSSPSSNPSTHHCPSPDSVNAVLESVLISAIDRTTLLRTQISQVKLSTPQQTTNQSLSKYSTSTEISLTHDSSSSQSLLCQNINCQIFPTIVSAETSNLSASVFSKARRTCQADSARMKIERSPDYWASKAREWASRNSPAGLESRGSSNQDDLLTLSNPIMTPAAEKEVPFEESLETSLGTRRDYFPRESISVVTQKCSEDSLKQIEHEGLSQFHTFGAAGTISAEGAPVEVNRRCNVRQDCTLSLETVEDCNELMEEKTDVGVGYEELRISKKPQSRSVDLESKKEGSDELMVTLERLVLRLKNSTEAPSASCYARAVLEWENMGTGACKKKKRKMRYRFNRK